MMCPGSGGPWQTGTENPICPACHIGPGGLNVKPPLRRLGKWTGKVPQHERRTN
ncbi:MAG: hypothetical protein FWC87_17275 [Acidimicrobiaceae bacterium]|nr:hypothetical protein [Acidimicrobiaceae bacterium]